MLTFFQGMRSKAGEALRQHVGPTVLGWAMEADKNKKDAALLTEAALDIALEEGCLAALLSAISTVHGMAAMEDYVIDDAMECNRACPAFCLLRRALPHRTHSQLCPALRSSSACAAR